jgi:hypothetical protein
MSLFRRLFSHSGVTSDDVVSIAHKHHIIAQKSSQTALDIIEDTERQKIVDNGIHESAQNLRRMLQDVLDRIR